MARANLIYVLETGALLYECPFSPEDPDHGLPAWYFERDDLTHLEVDREDDTVEWWPPIGPAPHWSAVWSQVEEDPITPLKRWHAKMY